MKIIHFNATDRHECTSILNLDFRWLITPFRDSGHLTRDQRKFNKVLSSLRQVLERAIGLLKEYWRKILYLDHLDERFSAKVIMAACVLNNVCVLHDDFCETYFLHNDDDDNDSGRRRGSRAAQLKRTQLMNIACL